MRASEAERGAFGRLRRRGARLLVRHPFRREKLDPRVLAAYAAAVALVIAARPTAASLAAGGALLALGAALRVWAAGHLVKNRALTCTGPYAHVRHPLYAGALLMGAGLAVAAGPRVAALALPPALLFFFARYLPRKERAESRRLAELYGDAFRDYAAAVPALLPRLRAWEKAPAGGRWRAAQVVANNEHSVAAWSAVALAAIALRLLA